MSELGQSPFEILSLEFDPTDRTVTITILDPIKQSREYGIYPEVRQLRIDGARWADQVAEVIDDITALVFDYEAAGKPMTRPGRGVVHDAGE